MTERVLRSETDMLKKQDLIKVKPTGMEITAEGEQLISQLKGYFDIYADDNRLSEGIKNKFQIKEVHVVPGDADNSQSVKTELGRQAGQLLEGILQEK